MNYNHVTKSESESNDFNILIKDRISSSFAETTNPYDCLDHQYFSAEITKLIRLRNEIEKDRFHRRLSNKDASL